MPIGKLDISVKVKVPRASTNPAKTAATRAWVTQHVGIAHYHDVEADQAELLVKRIRAQNKGLDIRGQWTGTREI